MLINNLKNLSNKKKKKDEIKIKKEKEKKDKLLINYNKDDEDKKEIENDNEKKLNNKESVKELGKYYLDSCNIKISKINKTYINSKKEKKSGDISSGKMNVNNNKGKTNQKLYKKKIVSKKKLVLDKNKIKAFNTIITNNSNFPLKNKIKELIKVLNYNKKINNILNDDNII